jgi:hypothetical protein
VASRAIRQAFKAMRISSDCVPFACDLASAAFVLALGRAAPDSAAIFVALSDFADIVSPSETGE